MRVAQRQADYELFTATIDGEGDNVAWLVLFHDSADVGGIDDLFAVDGYDQIAAHHDRHVAQIGLLIAAMNAGALGRSAGNYFLHQNAGLCRLAGYGGV